MEILIALVVGLLFACGLYMMMRRNIARVILGIVLLTQGANLLIFAAAGLTRGEPAFIAAGETTVAGVADPLPQALVLTAIVIGFGVLAFSLVLIQQTYQRTSTDDLDQLQTTDKE